MPQVSFYLRVEDVDKWSNLKNKAEFIHNALNKTPTPNIVNSSPPIPPKPKMAKSSVQPEIKKIIPGMLTAADLQPKIKERGTCRKCGSILATNGKCLMKGCR